MRQYLLFNRYMHRNSNVAIKKTITFTCSSVKLKSITIIIIIIIGGVGKQVYKCV